MSTVGVVTCTAHCLQMSMPGPGPPGKLHMHNEVWSKHPPSATPPSSSMVFTPPPPPPPPLPPPMHPCVSGLAHVEIFFTVCHIYLTLPVPPSLPLLSSPVLGQWKPELQLLSYNNQILSGGPLARPPLPPAPFPITATPATPRWPVGGREILGGVGRRERRGGGGGRGGAR